MRWAEKSKTGLGTELSQHVRGEERGLSFNEVHTVKRGWMQQLKRQKEEEEQ